MLNRCDRLRLGALCALGACAFTLQAQLLDDDGIFRGAFDPPVLQHMEREMLLLEVPGLEKLNPAQLVDVCRPNSINQPCADFGADFVGPESLDFHPELPDEAFPEVGAFSNETGRTYWANAVAPDGPRTLIPLTDPDLESTGLVALLDQMQWFRKSEGNASMRLKITSVRLEVLDNTLINGCPWLHTSVGTLEDCARLLFAGVEFDVYARRFDPPGTLYRDVEFFRAHGIAELEGFLPDVEFRTPHKADAGPKIWDELDFGVEEIEPGRFVATLRDTLTVEIPLGDLNDDESFVVAARLVVLGDNLVGRESYVSSYFRDPVEFEGAELEYDGVEPVDGPTGFWPALRQEPADRCDGPPELQHGVIEFTRDSYRAPEIPFSGSRVAIERRDGSQGKVSVLVSTLPDTATARLDYRPVKKHVVFENGEDGVRVIDIPILPDEQVEGVERFQVQLDDVRGCADLGTTTTAEFLILDDDRAGHTICGTVEGLVGSGLELSLNGVHFISPENGPFCFPGLYADGARYFIDLESQPSDPPQRCELANADGTVPGANVDDVSVTCRAPELIGALDPSFGTGGKVTGPLFGGATALAEQGDGDIIVAGERQLQRRFSDGELDIAFGGTGTVDFAGIGGGSVNAVAVQADGKIVAAGHDNADFRTYRYQPDGSPDLTFGVDGVVVTDWEGRLDRAYDVLIQPDGKIVVVGHREHGDPASLDYTGADFAIIRYLSDGTEDTAFGDNGRVAVNIAGNTDFGYGAALQTDGAILVTGRVARDGGSTPDVGVVRVLADGSLDSAFGINGIVRPETPTAWDEGADIVVQPDGKIVVTGRYPGAGFGVYRFLTSGEADTTFGLDGRAIETSFTDPVIPYAVALQSDGRIVVGGHIAQLVLQGGFNFAVARYTVDGQLDETFADDGGATVDFFGDTDMARALIIDDRGLILVGGSAVNAGTEELGLARLSTAPGQFP